MNKLFTTLSALTFCAGMCVLSSSCNNDDSNTVAPAYPDVHRVPIVLTTTLDDISGTRATESSSAYTAPTTLPGDCGVFFKPTTGSASTFNLANMYTYTPSGSALNLKTGSQPYFPATADGKVNIRAWYPATATTGIGAGNKTFTVQSNQSAYANYTASDLMFAFVDGQAPTTGKINLSFKHKLAKVTVIIKAGAGVYGTPTIVMKNVKPSVSFNLETLSSLTDVTGTGTATDITITSGATDSKGYSAIVPAQSFAAGTTLFTIKMSGGKSYTYTIPSGSTQSFISGKQNVFTFTLTGNGGITLTNSVTAWSANTTTEATL